MPKEEMIGEEIEENSRSMLNLQQFMSDMRLLSDQLKDKNLAIPVFDIGDGGVRNYLLWLILGELMILNDRLYEEEEQ